MLKHNLIFLSLFACTAFYSYNLQAAIQFLPRYQGFHGDKRSASGGRCPAIYQYLCAGEGYVSGMGSICGKKYKSCVCAKDFIWTGGKCFLNCNNDLFKYSCSGAGYATIQSDNKKCGSKYSECTCTDIYKWSGTACILKNCTDYGYLANENKTQSCNKETPRSGLECWNCKECQGTLYNCSSISNNDGADTSSMACGGRYATCKCKAGYYWNNGSCPKVCSNSCSLDSCPTGYACEKEECSGKYCIVGCQSNYTTPFNFIYNFYLF